MPNLVNPGGLLSTFVHVIRNRTHTYTHTHTPTNTIIATMQRQMFRTSFFIRSSEDECRVQSNKHVVGTNTFRFRRGGDCRRIVTQRFSAKVPQRTSSSTG